MERTQRSHAPTHCLLCIPATGQAPALHCTPFPLLASVAMSMLASFPLLLPESISGAGRSDEQTHSRAATTEAWHGLLACQQKTFRVRIVAATSKDNSRSSAAAVANGHAASAAAAAGGVVNLLESSTDRSAAALAAAVPTRHLLLQGEPALVQLLSGYQSMLAQRWNQSRDLTGFLVELQEIIVRPTCSRSRLQREGAGSQWREWR